MAWTRRGVLASGLAASLWPRTLRSAQADPEHRFVFLLARGGWDTSMVFASHDHCPDAELPGDGTQAALGDLSFVDSANRPSVRSFFETWGDRTCIVNGLEVRSVAHLRCRQLVLSGTAGASDDWPTLIAAHASRDYVLPNLVISGPSYALEYVSEVARVGGADQLAELVDGRALSSSGGVPLGGSVEERVDAWVKARASSFADAAQGGQEARFGELYASAMADMERIKGGDIPSFEMAWNGCGRDLGVDLSMAFDGLERDLCRCVMLEYRGVCGFTWDSHDNNEGQQNGHYEELFATLGQALEELEDRVASDGSPLADHVTFVVFSEMGRHPQYNAQNGRDHWTWTSAMLIGAGVAGGRTIGAVSESCTGEPVDLDEGVISDAGTSLLPEHLGSTLCHLAGLDGEAIIGVPPLLAALS